MIDTKILIILLVSAAGLVGIAFGYFLRWLLTLGQKGSMELTIKQTLLEAKQQAQKITEEAIKKAQEVEAQSKGKVEEKELQLKKLEDRLLNKDALLDKRQADLDRAGQSLKQKEGDLTAQMAEVEDLKQRGVEELERRGGLTQEHARAELMKTVEKQSEEDIWVKLQKLEAEGAERLDRRAKEILASTVQRLASSTAPELMTTTVQLASDDVKGKIIGKEGRNIRAFERAMGVEVIVDDTPGSIILSSFDPIRRQVAKLALQNLIRDGRIQPARIEEFAEKARGEIAKIVKEKGEAAAYETGVFNLDPKLLNILGRLHFRTSYGQNVLQHSTEMAHIAGMLAEELGADVATARAGALLHDIGKALDHEVQGTHVDIGRRILEKFGVDRRVIQAMQSHHEEYPYETTEAVIVQTADAISGGRPGARRDSTENYLKRLADLEAIANSFPGVAKTYAIQAGREIRVFVTPDEVSDLEAQRTARDIALRIEQELKYPGEIKVVVIRENRIVEFAR